MIDTSIFDRAWNSLPAAVRNRPADCALIFGSGWGDALSEWCTGAQVVASMPYASVAGLGASTVVGHKGELTILDKAGFRLWCFCGRRHWYEGCGWESVVLPVELLRRNGCRQLVLTNASGGIADGLFPGELVLLRDHFNLTGISPLQGAVVDGWGERFPDMSAVYSPRLNALLRQAAECAQVPLRDGVYAYSAGPAFETPAEIQIYKRLGADVIGMSTVPEAMVARACGIELACISCVTNLAAGIAVGPLDHNAILAKCHAAIPGMARLLADFLGLLRDGARSE